MTGVQTCASDLPADAPERLVQQVAALLQNRDAAAILAICHAQAAVEGSDQISQDA